jgi:hypothetical protein
MEGEYMRAEQAFESTNELAAEHLAEDTNREKERRGCPNPTGMIEREPANWDHAMQVRMVLKSLSPRMQHGEDADLRAEVFRIGGYILRVSAVASNRRSYKSFLFCKASAERSCATVKTTWKYGTGSRSSERCASHCSRALV